MKPLLAYLAAAMILGFAFLPSAHAAGPQDDLRAANVIVQRAIAATQAGDLGGALREYRAYENRWFEIEDGVREVSRDAYRAIEARMNEVGVALTAARPDKDEVLAALTALDQENQRFVAGLPPLAAAAPTATTTATSGKPTISTLLVLLNETEAAVTAGDFAAASARFETFSDNWLDVEGEVKTRSSSDYRQIENDMARISTALSKQQAEAVSLLDQMRLRLEPYRDAGDYEVFDATIIVLREGLEALLVVVALLAFVRKSGNDNKGGWIWAGAGAGLGASIALGVAIHVLFNEAFSGANRELMEGITGLFAAGMLLYVSFWLHSKSSLGAWQRYIGENTSRALARGSLLGLALLSFLAVFREGGETVLFLLGMTGRISAGDLLLGLGIGATFLTAFGVLLVAAGIRIPMRPFFAVASVLTFYLCFKFIGTGIHAMQIADVISAQTASYLPENETLGLFPTWQTTIPQALLILAGLAAVVRGRISDRALRSLPKAAAVAAE